ncbi:serine/threonine-protein kinase receptor [Plakobranchus ocellatus]|uniref:Serine/threonine-protein kinase receptor n=1 Tax=Plakobranchus ocellatus TaxID=259542 RepID=A0AAV4CBI7_9GAST|nr:serine/threonine-protein kinase receptor [Plakobranchus ocellatus]
MRESSQIHLHTWILMCVLAVLTNETWARLHQGTTKCSLLNEKMEEPGVEYCANKKDSQNRSIDQTFNYMTCFVSWMNSTEKGFMIMKKGCWLNDEACYNKKECISNQDKELLFCCCDGDNCNEKFRFEPAPESQYEPKPRIPIKNEHDENTVRRGENSRNKILLVTIVPIMAVVVIVVTSYFMYRRHQYRAFRGHTQLPTADPIMNGTGSRNVYPAINNPVRHALNLQLLELKAHGRYGSVWKAQLPDGFVAVKIFPQQDRQSFLAELEVYALPQLKHDNILKFIASEEREDGDSTKLWLITEYHDRGSLCDFLKGNTVSWADLCKIGETMACGLAYLHDEIPDTVHMKGKPAVAHRDLKSKNVLLKQDLTACIADFGLALKFEPGKCSNETHPQVGTRRYMAPEVLEGAICFNRDSFLRIDMYACGLIVWELMTRCIATDGPVSEYRLPFEAEVGQQPSLEDMQTLVVTRKMRPALNPLWSKHPGLSGLIPTVEECWDQDAEARLSAGCVQERIRHLARTVNSWQQGQRTTHQQVAQQPPLPSQPPQQQHQQHFLSSSMNSTATPTIMTSAPFPPPSSKYTVPPSVAPAYAPAVIDISRDATAETVSNGHLENHSGTSC